MAWLVHYLNGYVRIRLWGLTPERFFNLCSANGIEIWNIGCKENEYEFFMSVEGFFKAKPFFQKAKVRLKILKKLGLPFFLYRNRTRKLFFCGFVSFFVLLYSMSFFVWDIAFDGNHLYTYDTLINFLESEGIDYGMFKYGIDCDRLEEQLRSQFSEITWVSAQVSGTRLLVKIKENEVLSSIPINDTSPCNLVASKSGVITDLIVRTGVAKVKIGDQVEKGQILVEGMVPITNDGEEIVALHYVHADADIMAKTSYSYEKAYSNYYTKAVRNGRKRNGFFVKLFDYSMMVIPRRPKDTNWDTYMEEKQLKLFGNFYLPVFYGKIRSFEYMTYERAYTNEEKEELAKKYHKNFMEKLREKGVQILENNVKIRDNKGNFQIVGEIVAKELVGQIQTIVEQEEINNLDERDGNNH